MSENSPPVSSQAQDFGWLLSKFARETNGVSDMIALSADGLLMGVAGDVDRADGERLAAIVSGMANLAVSAGSGRGLGRLNKVIVDAEGGHLVIMAMGAGALLAAVVQRTASLATVSYEMALFINSIDAILTPGLIEELQNTLLG